PSLYEQPLTHDDLVRSLLIEDVRTDHFQQLLENQLPGMQRYPQQINEQLNRVVEQSREHLETVKLETAAMVAGYELELTAKQPVIEPQLEKPIEERPIVDERQQDARQEDLNPTLNHDDRELTR
ncbi:hypothetical protein, partial [Wohlfahrtiimonas populi]|uniref:hypothetical protein n=1 Tax=Wohlfahrtiimonas populi TaxID=1940240 RepID=UPI0013011231